MFIFFKWTSLQNDLKTKENHIRIIIIFHRYVVDISKETSNAIIYEVIKSTLKCIQTCDKNNLYKFNIVMYTLLLHPCFRQRSYMYKLIFNKTQITYTNSSMFKSNISFECICFLWNMKWNFYLKSYLFTRVSGPSRLTISITTTRDFVTKFTSQTTMLFTAISEKPSWTLWYHNGNTKQTNLYLLR